MDACGQPGQLGHAAYRKVLVTITAGMGAFPGLAVSMSVPNPAGAGIVPAYR